MSVPGAQVDTAIRLGEAFRDNTLGIVASLACLALVAVLVFVLKGASRRERELKAELKLAHEANREMGERLAVMSHDLIDKLSDLKWLRRAARDQVRREESESAPKPKRVVEVAP